MYIIIKLIKHNFKCTSWDNLQWDIFRNAYNLDMVYIITFSPSHVHLHLRHVYFHQHGPFSALSVGCSVCLLEWILMWKILFYILFVCICIKVCYKELFSCLSINMNIGGWRRYWPTTLWPPGISHWTPKCLPSQPQAINSALQKEWNTSKLHRIRTHRGHVVHANVVMFNNRDKL